MSPSKPEESPFTKGPVPLVSIIMPTYGRSHIFRRAAASALSQRGIDFELVVVSDGPDPAKREWCLGDPRILYDELPEHRGFTGNPARRHAISIARGDWITILDDDDLYRDEHALETVFAKRPFEMAVWSVETPWGEITAQTLAQMPKANFPPACSGIQFTVQRKHALNNWPARPAAAAPIFFKAAYLSTFGGPVHDPPGLKVIPEKLTRAYAAIEVQRGERVHDYTDRPAAIASG